MIEMSENRYQDKYFIMCFSYLEKCIFRSLGGLLFYFNWNILNNIVIDKRKLFIERYPYLYNIFCFRLIIYVGKFTYIADEVAISQQVIPVIV